MVLLTIGVLLSFNYWFPKAAQTYVTHKSDFNFHVGQSQCALYRGLVDFNNIEIQNPEKKFSQENCMSIDRFMVKVNLLSFLKSETVIDEVFINIDKVTCERTEDGRINLMELKTAFSPKESTASTEAVESRSKRKRGSQKSSAKAGTQDASAGDSFKFVIKKLHLHVGSFELYNITAKKEHKTINANLTWNFVDVHSTKEIGDTITTQLQNYGLSIIIQSLWGTVLDLPGIKTAKQAVQKVGQFSQDVLKNTAETVMGLLPFTKKDSPSPQQEASVTAAASPEAASALNPKPENVSPKPGNDEAYLPSPSPSPSPQQETRSKAQRKVRHRNLPKAEPSETTSTSATSATSASTPNSENKDAADLALPIIGHFKNLLGLSDKGND
ncbi:MAG: hypothetical protein LBB11_04150 [Puniceicoccales bacterium]|nr:hypothetical protein [Puniceicoccales bacterium]